MLLHAVGVGAVGNVAVGNGALGNGVVADGAIGSAVGSAVAVAVNALLHRKKNELFQNEVIDKWTHPDACAGRSEILKNSMAKYKAICTSQNL